VREPPVISWAAPAPGAGPMPEFEASAERVALGLAGVGTVEVTRSRIAVAAPDQAAIDATWARLGAWARGQWWALHGHLVLPGAVVARDGRAVAIVGPSRVGSTVTALQLTRHGYGVVSDSYAVVTPEGSVVGSSPTCAIDTMVAERLFSDYAPTTLPSGRPRSAVTPPAHPGCELAAVVLLQVKEGCREVMVRSLSPGIGDVLAHRVMWLGAPTVTPEPWSFSVPGWSFARKSPDTLDELERVGPPAMAEAIARTMEASWT